MHTFIIISIQYEIKINRSAYGSLVASGLFPTETSYSALATDCKGTVVRGDRNELRAEPFINNLPAFFARMEFLSVRLNIAWLFVFHFDQRVQRLAPTSLQIRARTGCNLVNGGVLLRVTFQSESHFIFNSGIPSPRLHFFTWIINEIESTGDVIWYAKGKKVSFAVTL